MAPLVGPIAVISLAGNGALWRGSSFWLNDPSLYL